MLKNAYSYGQRVYIVVPTNVFPVLYQLFCFMTCILPFDYIRFFAFELINAVLHQFLIVLCCHPVLDIVLPILNTLEFRLSSFYFYHLYL